MIDIFKIINLTKTVVHIIVFCYDNSKIFINKYHVDLFSNSPLRNNDYIELNKDEMIIFYKFIKDYIENHGEINAEQYFPEYKLWGWDDKEISNIFNILRDNKLNQII